MSENKVADFPISWMFYASYDFSFSVSSPQFQDRLCKVKKEVVITETLRS